VRDRFAVALADARHRFVMADSEAAVRDAVAGAAPVHLAILDLALSAQPAAFVEHVRGGAQPPRPVVVFAGSVASAADIPALAPLGVSYINEHAGTPFILPAIAPLLFPDSFNRRASERRAIGVPVTYRSGDTISGAVTLDVGKGGLGIRTMNPLPKTTMVHVRFRLPGSAGEIEASGRVAWSDRKVGMGVQFEKVSSAHQHAIDAFVEDR
jgi:uncharacterized protein (TIGR02266 family)